SAQGQPGGAPSFSGHRTAVAVQPSPARRWLTPPAGAVLPDPASPLTSTICIRPAAASRADRATWLSSASWPAYGASVVGAASVPAGAGTAATEVCDSAAGGADRRGACARISLSSSRKSGPGRRRDQQPAPPA